MRVRGRQISCYPKVATRRDPCCHPRCSGQKTAASVPAKLEDLDWINIPQIALSSAAMAETRILSSLEPCHPGLECLFLGSYVVKSRSVEERL